MRNRDGNYAFSLSICSLILTNSLVLDASEYLISYRYTVQDAILYSEKLQVAHAMKKCEGKAQKPLILESYADNDLQKTLLANSNEFIDYIHTLGLHVRHRSLTTDFQNKSTTVLTLKTT